MIFINTQTKEYPVSLSTLRKRFPNTSIPTSAVSHEEYAKVYDGVIPSYTTTQYIEEDAPVFVNNQYQRNWVVKNYTDDQVASREANALAVASNSVRAERNTLLSASDWTQVADAPVDQAAWATYRQALRDITTQTDFPWSVTWPVAP